MSFIYQKWKVTGTVDPSIPIGAFADLSLSQIKQVCDAGEAADYVSNGTWTIGDTNTNATYGSYSGIRLVHVLTDTQRGSDYYGTNGHIVVEFVNTITISKWHSSYSTQTSYSAATILSTLNTIYSSGINSELRAVLSSFAPSTSVQSSSSSSSATTSIEHPSGYLHVPNCVEVGSTNSYRPSENDKSFCFTYYSDSSTASSRRIKSGASTYWWLRSPSYYDNGDRYFAYGVYDDGDVSSSIEYGVSSTLGVAPIGCI